MSQYGQLVIDSNNSYKICNIQGLLEKERGDWCVLLHKNVFVNILNAKNIRSVK